MCLQQEALEWYLRALSGLHRWETRAVAADWPCVSPVLLPIWNAWTERCFLWCALYAFKVMFFHSPSALLYWPNTDTSCKTDSSRPQNSSTELLSLALGLVLFIWHSFTATHKSAVLIPWSLDTGRFTADRSGCYLMATNTTKHWEPTAETLPSKNKLPILNKWTVVRELMLLKLNS